MNEPVIEHHYTSEIVCPHCGYKQMDSWEYSGDSGEIDCGKCSEPFLYERQVSVSYSTSKILPNEK